MGKDLVKVITQAEIDRNEIRDDLLRKMADAVGMLKGSAHLLPSERAALVRALMAMPSISGQGLTRRAVLSTGEIRIEVNTVELTSRMMRLNESLEVAVAATSEKPRRHADKGGWAPIRQPTPGRRAGTQKHSL